MSSVIFTPWIAPSLLSHKQNISVLADRSCCFANPKSLFVYKCLWGGVRKSNRKGSRVFTNAQKVSDVSLGWDTLGQDDPGDTKSPWEGAIIYRRNSSISHLEYCTTLERLGLEKVSTEFSRSRASDMGLRVTKDVKDYPLGTPVQISIDVTRKKQKLRLDGIIKTVLDLACTRCGEPAAESIYSNFSLLLSEEPIEEPDIIDMGMIFAQDKFKMGGFGEEGDDDDNDSSIDWDDRFYFPPEEKEIDISKNIRDLVHIEITDNAVCDPSCKGLCECGVNLNKGSCRCSKGNNEKNYGPLKDLRKTMQHKV